MGKFKPQLLNFLFKSLILACAAPSYAYIGGSYPEGLFPSTVRITMMKQSCGAVKVADNFLLTAAHCNTFGGLEKGNTLSLDNYTGSPLSDHLDKVTIKNLYIHPRFPKPIVEFTDDTPDLALVEISELKTVPNAKIRLHPISTTDTVIVGGFGCKGIGFPRYPHLTVAVKKPVSLKSHYFTTGLEDFNLDTQKNDKDSLSIGCPGDSGGPAYAISKNNTFEVVGINSAVDSSESYFKVDPKTGSILPFTGNSPLFYISKTGYDSKDVYGVARWIKSILSPESYSDNP